METDETRDVQAEGSNEEKAIVSAPSQVTPVLLGGSVDLDLSALPEEQRVALQVEYARGMIEINKRAQELGVDVMALDRALQSMVETTQAVSANNDAVTITNTQDNSIGRTEIIMGNTEHAMKGKLTKSQTGERDLNPYLIGFGILGATIIGVVIVRGG